jgi:hypothetical protein
MIIMTQEDVGRPQFNFHSIDVTREVCVIEDNHGHKHNAAGCILFMKRRKSAENALHRHMS